jgi:hypothetical protein
LRHLRPLFLVFSLSFCLGAAAQPAPDVIRTQAQLQAALASSTPTPLDALTPYGKRRFVQSLRWGSAGVAGFNFIALVRELNATQLAAVLAYIDSSSQMSRLADELQGAPLRLPGPSTDIEGRFDTLVRVADAPAAATGPVTTLRDPALDRAYAELFEARMTPQALQRAAPGDLPLLFDAASTVDAREPGTAAFDDMVRIHREMQARGIDTRRSFDDALFRSMLAARRFEAAKSFAAAHPALANAVVPHVNDALGAGFTGRSVFHYDAATNTLTRAAAPPSGKELVIVVGAGCHFSRDALDAIHTDPALRDRLRQANVRIMVPPSEAISFRFVAAWNAANPTLPIDIPYDVKEWQVLKQTGVPYFYLLKDGKPVAELDSGWPEGGNKAALLALIDGNSR